MDRLWAPHFQNGSAIAVGRSLGLLANSYLVPVRLQFSSFFSHIYSISLFVSLVHLHFKIKNTINERIEFHRSYLLRSLGPWISSTECTQ